MTSRNYVDISFTVKDSVRQGRKLLRDLDTGQMFYDPPEPVVPEGGFDGPPNPPLPPKVDLIAAHNADVDAAFDVEEKRLLKEAFEPINPAPKPRAKKRLLHG